MSISTIVREYFEEAVKEAKECGYSDEGVARPTLPLVIEIYRENSSIEKTADELTYCIDNLDSNVDYVFMRPRLRRLPDTVRYKCDDLTKFHGQTQTQNDASC